MYNRHPEGSQKIKSETEKRILQAMKAVCLKNELHRFLMLRGIFRIICSNL